MTDGRCFVEATQTIMLETSRLIVAENIPLRGHIRSFRHHWTSEPVLRQPRSSIVSSEISGSFSLNQLTSFVPSRGTSFCVRRINKVLKQNAARRRASRGGKVRWLSPRVSNRVLKSFNAGVGNAVTAIT
jgi:hypothetical protein